MIYIVLFLFGLVYFVLAVIFSSLIWRYVGVKKGFEVA
jgi:hypothetical protein